MLDRRLVIAAHLLASEYDEADIASAFAFDRPLPEDFVRLWDGRTLNWLQRMEEAELCRSLEEMSVDGQRAMYLAIRRRASDLSAQVYGRQSKWFRSFESRVAEVSENFIHPMTRGQIIRAAMYVEAHIRDEIAYQQADDQATRRFEAMAYG